jgi:hypothetical protein
MSILRERAYEDDGIAASRGISGSALAPSPACAPVPIRGEVAVSGPEGQGSAHRSGFPHKVAPLRRTLMTVRITVGNARGWASGQSGRGTAAALSLKAIDRSVCPGYGLTARALRRRVCPVFWAVRLMHRSLVRALRAAPFPAFRTPLRSEDSGRFVLNSA